jgi:hypothetical protein
VTMLRRHHIKRCIVFTSRAVEVIAAHLMKASLPFRSEHTNGRLIFYRQHWPRNATPPAPDY